MPIFHYIASNAKGESIRGDISAATKNEVAKKVRALGLFMVSCKSDEITPVKPAPTSSSVKRVTHLVSTWKAKQIGMPNPVGRPSGQIPLKEMMVLTRQISISIKAGMSFVNALQRMSQRAKNPVTAFVLNHILNDVLSGKKFSEALSAHPTVFSPLYVSLVAAGESSGMMPQALNRVADYLEKEMDLNAKIKSAMIYPLMIAGVATVVVMGTMIFIVPTFVKVFQDINMPLPWPTRVLIGVSAFFRHGGYLLPFALVGLFLGLQKLRLTNEGLRVWWDKTILKLPIFGRLVTLEVITRFIRTLSSLIDNGVMALESITIARQVVQNRAIEEVVDQLIASVQRGNGLSPVLYGSSYFPELVADMVSTGETTGSLPEVMNKMADYYESEIAATVRDILTMLEPLMIVAMAVVVGFIIAGLMLPSIVMPSAIGQ